MWGGPPWSQRTVKNELGVVCEQWQAGFLPLGFPVTAPALGGHGGLGGAVSRGKRTNRSTLQLKLNLPSLLIFCYLALVLVNAASEHTCVPASPCPSVCPQSAWLPVTPPYKCISECTCMSEGVCVCAQVCLCVLQSAWVSASISRLAHLPVCDLPLSLCLSSPLCVCVVVVV